VSLHHIKNNMESPLTYYQKHLEVYTTEVQRLFKKMALLSTLRVLVFLATTFGVYMMFDYWQMAALIGMVGMAVFLYVLSRYNDVKAKRDFNAKLIAINERSEERRVGKECRFSVWSLS